MRKAIINEMRAKGLKRYIIKESDIDRFIDFDTFFQVNKSDIGKMLVLQSFGLQMESNAQKEKRLQGLRI